MPHDLTVNTLTNWMYDWYGCDRSPCLIRQRQLVVVAVF
jgi:hypothetical protein